MSLSAWNLTYPIGTPVDWLRSDGQIYRTRTDTVATALESGLVVLGLEDSALPVLLSHVRAAVENTSDLETK